MADESSPPAAAPEPVDPRAEMLARYGRLCGRIEELIEEWAAATVMEDKKEWAMTLASMTLAAQRVAGLRLMLESATPLKDEESDDASTDPQSQAIRRHWQTLAGEASGERGPGAD